MRTEHNRHTAGRYLQALIMGKHQPTNALAWAESQTQWSDQRPVVAAIKAAISAYATDDFPGELSFIADSFLNAMRDISVPLRLPTLRKTPMHTRVFVNAQGVVVAQVTEGGAIPVLKGDWNAITLRPRKFAGIVVQTEELAKSASPAAPLAIVDDLAGATAEAENLGFLNPSETGSVLDGAPSFVSGGGSVAQVDADLRKLVDMVPGAHRPGAAFCMCKETATYLSLLRGSGGAAAYPNITPQGGTLLGLPVLITKACGEPASPTINIVALVNPREILWADEGRVILTTSNQAALKMDDAATAAAGSLISMWHTNSVATKAIRECSWHARTGSAAYFTCGF